MDGADVKGVRQWMTLMSRVCDNGWRCCQGCVVMDDIDVKGL